MVQAHRSEAGFTLVELLAAILVLVIGMLGVLTMVVGANTSTKTAHARSTGTAIARELLETARGQTFSTLATSSLLSAAQAVPALANATANPTYTIARRGFRYQVDLNVCAIDDPKDGRGDQSGEPFCAGTAGPDVEDADAVDFKRVTATLTWTQDGRERTVRQATVLGKRGADAAMVRSLRVTSPTVPDPAAPVITSTSVTTTTWRIVTSSSAASVTVAVDGVDRGPATPAGNGTDWNFSLPISGWKDGSYEISARASDAYGATGPTATTSLVLVRSPPEAPTGLTGGYNTVLHDGAPTTVVELEWLPSDERHVVGYRTYRPDMTVACEDDPQSSQRELSCVDLSPLDGTYRVAALYFDAAGVLREGPRASFAVSESTPYFFRNNTNNTGDACPSANVRRDIDPNWAGGTEATHNFASGGDIIAFCFRSGPYTVPAGRYVARLWMQNTHASNNCTGSVAMLRGSTTQVSSAVSLPAATARREFAVVLNLPSPFYVHDETRASVVVNLPGTSCDGGRLHYSGTVDRSRLDMPDANRETPGTPPNLAGTRAADGSVTLTWSQPAGTINYYRIYRDGQSLGHRYDRTDGGELSYVDPNTDGGTHTYHVTAVGRFLSESPHTPGLTR
jgi:type II secretory pathway pseudopilin PulG